MSSLKKANLKTFKSRFVHIRRSSYVAAYVFFFTKELLKRSAYCKVGKNHINFNLYTLFIQGVSGGIVNILGGDSMDYSE
jgi:hypothetical protein